MALIMHTRAGEIVGVSRVVKLTFVAVTDVLPSADVAVLPPRRR